MGDYAYQPPNQAAAFSSGFAAPFSKIGAALGQPAGAGALNRAGYDSRKAAPNSNIDKLKALGLSAMPAGGQEELDGLWAKRGGK